MKKTKLSSASDVITRKRQQGTTEHYIILDEKNQLPIGGIPQSFQDYNLVKGGDGGDGHLKLTIIRQ